MSFMDDAREEVRRELRNGAPSANGTPSRRTAAPPLQLTPGNADDAETLFADTDRLHELAAWRLYDPARYSAEEARLKRHGVSVRRLEQVTSRLAGAMRVRDTHKGRLPDRADRSRYFVAGNVIYRADTKADVPLCNFAARIVADVTTDDGTECRRRLRVTGTLDTGAALLEVEVAAERFAAMDWPMNEWGTRAIVAAGAGAKDHLRVAILTNSPDVRHETQYAHTGWRELDGRWCYLHAGGAIGSDGPVPGVRVALPSPLAGYALPSLPAGERVRAAVRASLGLLRDLAPDEVTVPLLIAPYRAVLGGADYSLGLVGRTGAGKSELAALAQQHFGATLTARHLPANWSSTANATEALAFAAKDALLVVDDYCPVGPADSAKLQATVAGWSAGRATTPAGRG